MTRLIAFACAVACVSVSLAGVGVVGVTVTGGQCAPVGGPVGPVGLGASFGAAGRLGGSLAPSGISPFPSPSLGATYGAAGFPGGSFGYGNPTPVGSTCFGPGYGSWGCGYGSCYPGFGMPCYPGNWGPNFCGAFVPGNCRFGFGGAGCSILPGCGFGPGAVNCNLLSRNNNISYLPWYDQGYGWAGSWGMSAYDGGYGNGSVGNALYSANDYAYRAPAPTRSQFIQFPTPLAEGTAQIRIEVPSGAEVTIQGRPVGGKGSGRVFVTPALKGPTPFEVQLTTTVDGKPAKQSMTVTVAPGDQRQVMFLR